MISRRSTPHGLTLVEIMIAIAITALMGAMVMGSFQRVFRAKELTEEQDDLFIPARTTLARAARELSQAFLSEHYDHSRFREAPTLFRGKSNELLFTTMSHARLLRDAKESDQAMVAYTVESDPDHPGELALFRREKTLIDDDPDHGGTKSVVCEHVVSFDLEYWDWKRQSWTREWITNGIDHNGILPTRVKLRLGLKQPDGEIRNFETQTRIAIIRPLSF